MSKRGIDDIPAWVLMVSVFVPAFILFWIYLTREEE